MCTSTSPPWGRPTSATTMSVIMMLPVHWVPTIPSCMRRAWSSGSTPDLRATSGARGGSLFQASTLSTVRSEIRNLKPLSPDKHKTLAFSGWLRVRCNKATGDEKAGAYKFQIKPLKNISHSGGGREGSTWRLLWELVFLTTVCQTTDCQDESPGWVWTRHISLL